MDLREYDGKMVRITTGGGQTFVGFADYHYADDNVSGIESLTLEVGTDSNIIMLEFGETEIANIEMLTSNATAAAIPA